VARFGSPWCSSWVRREWGGNWRGGALLGFREGGSPSSSTPWQPPLPPVRRVVVAPRRMRQCPLCAVDHLGASTTIMHRSQLSEQDAWGDVHVAGVLIFSQHCFLLSLLYRGRLRMQIHILAGVSLTYRRPSDSPCF
jgi:hypothetical protein